MKPVLALIALGSSVLLVGCHTAPSKVATTAATPTVIIPAVTHRPATAPLPSTAQVSGYNAAVGSPTVPLAFTPASRGTPVYTAPKIVKVTLAAYEDEKGRLFGPQVMYQKVDEGHMNVEALNGNPDLAYIPSESLVVPPGMGNPVSAAAMERKAADEPRMPTDYYDPRDITPTGLMSKEANRNEAERMAAAAGRRAVFDPDIGWLLVPVAQK